MNNLSNYIIEKLHLDKNIKIADDSKYSDIYKVYEDDTVLCISSSSKSIGSTIKYVKLFVAKIYSIENDTIILRSLKNGKVIDKIKFKFEDHTKSSAHVTDTFAFYRDDANNRNWCAIMKKEKALKTIDRLLNSSSKYYHISGFRIDHGLQNKKEYLNEIKKTLNEND